KLGDKTILRPETYRLMTTPHKVETAKGAGLRCGGWDMDTPYSANRGSFPKGVGYGHTGFTGTSIWIDPTARTAVIFLSNRVHPNGKGNVTRLRGQVATLVAASIAAPPFPKPRLAVPASPPARAVSTVLTGIAILVRENFR